MTAMFWIALVALLVACPVLAAWSLNAARKSGDVERFEQAKAELGETIGRDILTPLVAWLDRQLRRSPRLYAWLSR